MTLDELKLLMALHGEARIEYLEEEIFASRVLYTYYLEMLKRLNCDAMDIYAYDRSGSAWFAYKYAKHIIKGRWLEAEHVIISDIYTATLYAMHVMGHKWPQLDSKLRYMDNEYITPGYNCLPLFDGENLTDSDVKS